MRMVVALVLIGLGSGQAALALDKFKVTPDERAACQQDATMLCGYTFPDEDQLVVCMKANKDHLTKICRTTLETGLRRRHMSTN